MRPTLPDQAGTSWQAKLGTGKNQPWIDIEEEENSVTLALGGDPSNTATEKADENSGADQKHGAGRSFAFGSLLG